MTHYFTFKSNTFQVIKLIGIYFFLKFTDVKNDHNSKYFSYVFVENNGCDGMADNFQV